MIFSHEPSHNRTVTSEILPLRMPVVRIAQKELKNKKRKGIIAQKRLLTPRRDMKKGGRISAPP